jgi:hypothetical protein
VLVVWGSASTREHKYKRTDLDAMGSDGELTWGGDPDRPYVVKSHRRDPAVRFVKSLCAPCNNARSQPFDRAYDIYSNYVRPAGRIGFGGLITDA